MTAQEREVIEGQAESVSQLPAVQDEHQVQVFNPLDAPPAQFAQQLTQRSSNYDALALHLRDQLVPNKDFGRIHVAKKEKCPRPWECSHAQNPSHWSGFTLFSPGADKVLGILGLGVQYPDEQDYRRAALSGKPISDIIIKVWIVSSNEQKICEGMGAASVQEHYGNLNNALKKALKRARLDAVTRIPTISALFEDDFLAALAASESAKTANTAKARSQQYDNKYNTGAHLTEFPFGKKLKGVAFTAMDEDTLGWILANFQDKPDIYNAANREIQRRQTGMTGPAGLQTPAKNPPDSGSTITDDVPFDDELPPLNAYE